MNKLGELGMNAANSATGQILGLALGGVQDARQRRQAQKLQDIQMKGNKEMADYTHQLGLDMWEKTNYEAQVKQMEKAGLNVGLMYGGGGGGGGTTAGAGQAGAVSGQSAGDPNAGTGMGMQLAGQLQLMQAQKENIEADTANKKASAGGTTATTAGTEFQNKVNELIGVKQVADRYQAESDKIAIESEKMNAEWEAIKQHGYDGGNFIGEHTPIAKAMKAGWNKAVIDLQNAKTAGNIAEAEKTIKQYQAGLTKEGIDPNSPWYVKIIGDLLAKVGLNPITAAKGALK